MAKFKDYESDQYNEMRNQSYQQLMQSEIQASAAKQQALKYTNDAMARSGYGTQGLSESSQLGVQNQYQQALAQANQQHSNNLYNIDQQQMSAFKDASKQNAESLITLMQAAGDEDTLNEYMQSDAYKKYRDTLTDDDSLYVDNMYEALLKNMAQNKQDEEYKNELANAGVEDPNAYISPDKFYTTINNNEDYNGLGEQEDEQDILLRQMQQDAINGTLETGYYDLNVGAGSKSIYYYDGKNFYKTTNNAKATKLEHYYKDLYEQIMNNNKPKNWGNTRKTIPNAYNRQ